MPEDKALMAMHLLCEGSSVGALSRVTGLHKGTVLKLLVAAGEHCERLMAERIAGVPVADVECDEVWSFVGCKERLKAERGDSDPEKGDAYCYIGLERPPSACSRGTSAGARRSTRTPSSRKLDRATDGHFQISTDGLHLYPNAIGWHLGHRTDYATIIKQYGSSPDGERRYSPARLTGTERTRVHGNPKASSRVCTSYVEGFNLSLRTSMRRWTRLTIAFSPAGRTTRRRSRFSTPSTTSARSTAASASPRRWRPAWLSGRGRSGI